MATPAYAHGQKLNNNMKSPSVSPQHQYKKKGGGGGGFYIYYHIPFTITHHIRSNIDNSNGIINQADKHL